MVKLLTVRKILFFIIILTVFLLSVLFYKLHHQSYKSSNLNLSKEELSLIELDLQSFLMYNNPSISLVQDYKNLINSKYNHSVYSLHRFNLISSVLFLLLPLMLIIFLFLMLGVSLRMTLFVGLVFFLFSLTPILLF